jgi:hypothetical protein
LPKGRTKSTRRGIKDVLVFRGVKVMGAPRVTTRLVIYDI